MCNQYFALNRYTTAMCKWGNYQQRKRSKSRRCSFGGKLETLLSVNFASEIREMNGLREIMRERWKQKRVLEEGWCGERSGKSKTGTTQKAKDVMIQDERKGSGGRGVSESERKMEKERRGGVGSHLKAKWPCKLMNLRHFCFLFFPFLSILHSLCCSVSLTQTGTMATKAHCSYLTPHWTLPKSTHWWTTKLWPAPCCSPRASTSQGWWWIGLTPWTNEHTTCSSSAQVLIVLLLSALISPSRIWQYCDCSKTQFQFFWTKFPPQNTNRKGLKHKSCFSFYFMFVSTKNLLVPVFLLNGLSSDCVFVMVLVLPSASPRPVYWCSLHSAQSPLLISHNKHCHFKPLSSCGWMPSPTYRLKTCTSFQVHVTAAFSSILKKIQFWKVNENMKCIAHSWESCLYSTK